MRRSAKGLTAVRSTATCKSQRLASRLTPGSVLNAGTTLTRMAAGSTPFTRHHAHTHNTHTRIHAHTHAHTTTNPPFTTLAHAGGVYLCPRAPRGTGPARRVCDLAGCRNTCPEPPFVCVCVCVISVLYQDFLELSFSYVIPERPSLCNGTYVGIVRMRQDGLSLATVGAQVHKVKKNSPFALFHSARDQSGNSSFPNDTNFLSAEVQGI